MQMARELDDAILSLRTNQLDVGLWVFRTEGERTNVLAADSALFANRDHWFVREVIGMMRRTFARLDVTSRSMYALVEPESCLAGSLLELALAADRVYMLDDPTVFGRALGTEFRRTRCRQRCDPDRCAILLRPAAR